MKQFLVVVAVTLTCATGLIVPSSLTTKPTTLLKYAKQDENLDEMRQDIEDMRKEALQKIEKINQKMKQQELKTTKIESNNIASEQSTIRVTTESSQDNKGRRSDADLLELMDVERQALDNHNKNHNVLQTSNNNVGAQLKLMDDTRWRVNLNIGREPGTWMPQDWGVSGERLYLNLELEFSNEQLYEREEFLNGISGTKVLKAVHNEAYLSPTLKEGGRQVRVKNGGWRVAPGEGPVGTTVLRFYVELEEQTQHNGSDVYAPAGRIYCTCGYFPMKDHEAASVKESLSKEHDSLVQKYNRLAQENERDDKLVSWDKLKRNKQMMDLRMQANKLSRNMNEAAVREPERSFLRLSQDQSLGLTREGGVCCKVQKGLAIEYHILGKFEIASMENREHNDYRESLSP